jgi:cytoskeletal protein CcmA (bactofilin family)
MVFRKDNKVDAFQRQISALRQQLGSGDEAMEGASEEADERGYVEERAMAQANPPGNQGRVYGGRDPSAFNFGGFGSSTSITPAAESEELDVLTAPVPATILPPDAQTSVIAHGTTWKGDLHSTGTIHVHGRVEGSLEATQDIYVAEEANVDATIVASNVVIAGLVKGTIRCGARFEVLPAGRVTGDITTPALVIHEGANISGQFRMGTQENAGQQRPTSVVQRRTARGGA